jgi:hypothetical protein
MGLAFTLMGQLGRMLASQLGVAGVVMVAVTDGSRPNFLQHTRQDFKLMMLRCIRLPYCKRDEKAKSLE